MPDKVRIQFNPVNRTTEVPYGSSVLEAIRQAHIPFESICGGKGECGKCKIILLDGRTDRGTPESLKGLSEWEIQKNYCRACQTHVFGDCEFILPVESRIDSPRILTVLTEPADGLDPSVTKHLLVSTGPAAPPAGHRSQTLEGYRGPRPHMTRYQKEDLAGSSGPVTVTVTRSNRYPEVLSIEPGDTRDRVFGLAVDLGTTTVVGALVDLGTGRTVALATAMNRQITYGEELLTRIAYARKAEGKGRLAEAAAASINEVIEKLVAGVNVQSADICDVCLAGNTVMQYLILGKDAGILEIANAAIPRNPEIVRAKTLGLLTHPGAYVSFLPAVSRFVGGDAIGDIIASGMHRSDDLSLLIDLGTNGEVVLGNRDWLASVSCASGPAFEGAGISAGLRAMKGAIDHVAIDPETCAVSWTTIGNAKPRGICGSGIIDAAAAMVGAGILDFTGRFVENRPGVREGSFGPEFVLVPADLTATGQDIVITRQDMAYLIDSKAAACGAVGVLLRKYRIGIRDIKNVYLAGAFGAYADREKICRFGILPDFPGARYHGLGNGSLSGARMLLCSLGLRKEAEDVARKMVYIDLLVDADFIEEYSAAIYIPGKKEFFG